jgi:hypothetical protein
MIEKFTLYVGLNDKDTKIQEVSTIEAYKIIKKLLLSYTDGATIFEADGIYKHDDGSFVTEKTLRIELMFIEKTTVKEIVDNIKRLLNQESVAVQREVVESELW